MNVVEGPVKLNTGAPLVLKFTSVSGEVADALATLPDAPIGIEQIADVQQVEAELKCVLLRTV